VMLLEQGLVKMFAFNWGINVYLLDSSPWPTAMSRRPVTDRMKELFPAPVTPIMATTISSDDEPIVTEEGRPAAIDKY
jgi:hypothetical protein